MLPFLLGFAAAYWLFGLGLMTSLFVGGTLTATSIGITVRVLTHLRRQHTPEAQVVLGAAVLDDVLGVVLLAVLSGRRHQSHQRRPGWRCRGASFFRSA